VSVNDASQRANILVRLSISLQSNCTTRATLTRAVLDKRCFAVMNRDFVTKIPAERFPRDEKILC
jgi:hypothetical protein